jgi:hypothetical protein
MLIFPAVSQHKRVLDFMRIYVTLVVSSADES